MSRVIHPFRPIGAVALLAILLCGCQPDTSIELYNNSGVPLIVSGCNALVRAEPSAVVELGSIHGCSDGVQVTGPNSKWRYQLENPGSGYLHDDRWTIFRATLTIRLQINSDHRVFALPVGATFPISDDTAQPRPYPLHAHSEA